MTVKITWRNGDERIDETIARYDASLQSQDAIAAHVIRMIRGLGMQPGDTITIAEVAA